MGFVCFMAKISQFFGTKKRPNRRFLNGIPLFLFSLSLVLFFFYCPEARIFVSIKLIKMYDEKITARPIAAHFMAFVPSFTLLASPIDVSHKKPP